MAPDLPLISTPVPVDSRLLDPLSKLRGSIRKYVLLEGIALIATFLALWFWLGMIADYGLFRATRWDWVLDVNWWIRAAVLAVVIVMLISMVITRIITLFFGEFSDRALAMVLEKRFPTILGDRLLTAIDLADAKATEKYGYSPELIHHTIHEATIRVAELPLNQVFDYVRLRRAILKPFILGFGGLILVAAGVGVYANVHAEGKVGEYVSKSMDVTTIWAERNLLLQNTPWPRNVQLEVLDFGPSAERRIARDGSATTIRVRANKFVIADATVFDGWRRMRWDEVTADRIGMTPVVLDGLSKIAAPTEKDAVRLPADLPKSLEAWAAWPIDRVEATLLTNIPVRDYLRSKMPPEWFISLEKTFEHLDRAVRDPANSRKFRILEVPTEVLLESWGAKTANEMPLRRENDNEFTGVLSELKESVWLRVTAGDAISPRYRLTLVPPPQLVKLERDELRPAYLYHRPSSDGKAAGLRGLQQVFPNLGISLSGDKSRFEIPFGTDLTLRGSADKELTAVTILPKAGRYPGIETGVETGSGPTPIALGLADDQRSFELTFSEQKRITRLTEFEIELLDTDNVRSKRLIQIQPIDDKAPEVEVSLEVIRRIGGTYICTPAALIPFAPESRIRDDHGLNRVDYRFSYQQLESAGINSSRTLIAGGMFMSPILRPTIGTVVHPVFYLREFGKSIAPATTISLTRFEPVQGFDDLWRQKPTPIQAALVQALKQPRATGADDPIIHQFDFRSSGPQGFDLQKVLPDIEVKLPSQVQPRYRIELSVTATDTNVEAFTPTNKNPTITVDGRVSENREVFNLLVIPEADLLVEISKEEEALAARLDIILGRLRDSHAKIIGIVEGLPKLPADQIVPTSTRSSEIVETVSKSKDLTTDLLKDFERILREYQYNRCSKNILDKVEGQICTPLREAMRKDFPEVEDSLGQFNRALAELTKPEMTVAIQSRDRMAVLIQRLERVRAGMGEVTDEKKVIAAIQAIIQGQENQIAPQLQRILTGASEDLLAPKIIQSPAVNVASLGTIKGKLTIDFGLEFDGELTLKLEAPANSELTVPAQVKVKSTEEPLTVEFDIKAGTKKGDFPLKVTPSAGRAITLIVTVK